MLISKLKYKDTIPALSIQPKQIWADSRNIDSERTSFFQVQYIERGAMLCTLYKGNGRGYARNPNGLYGFNLDTLKLITIVEVCE